MLRITTLFLTIICAQIVSSQNYRYFHLQEKDGLQSELIKSITQDETGNIWLATDDGLIKFNGKSFTQYKDELPSPYSKFVFRHSGGRLYASTDLGLIEIDQLGYNTDFTTIIPGSFNKQDTLLWFAKHIFEDYQNRIWITDNQSVFKYVPDGNIRRYALPPKNVSSHFQSSFSIAGDTLGNLYLTSRPGYMYYFQNQIDSFVEIRHQLPKCDFHQLVHVDRNTYLLNTSNGLYAVNLSKNNAIEEYKLIRDDLDLSHILPFANKTSYAGSWSKGLFSIFYSDNKEFTCKPIGDKNIKGISFLYHSKSGEDVWIGTDNGIYLQQPTHFMPMYTDISPNYIQDIKVLGDTYIYYSDGGSVKQIDQKQPYKPPIELLSLPNTTILQLAPNSTGLWLACANGQLLRYEKKHISKKIDLSEYGGALFCMLSDAENNLWICQDNNPGLLKIRPNGNIKHYTKSDGIVSRPMSLAISPDNKLHVGASNDSSYLFRYNPQNEKFTNISQPLHFNHNAEININDIAFKNGSDTIWLGSSFGLLKQYHNVVEQMDAGVVTSNAIKALTIDQNQIFWFANNKGLINLWKNTPLAFEEIAGLPSKVIAYRSLIADAYNRIWVGTVAGLAMSENNKKYKTTPKPRIIRFESQGKMLPNASKYSIYTQDYIKINFISFSFPGNFISYQMQLSPRDSAWKDMGNNHEFMLANLKKGQYNLRLRAKQRGNFLWSQPLEIVLTVHPPWYLTVWGITLIIILTLGLAVLIAMLHSLKLKKDKELLERQVRERTSKIQYQKDEIADHRDSLSRQLTYIERQSKNIEDSLHYAQRIQSALLPHGNLLKQTLPNHFIILLPRDIVSGDFYWANQLGSRTIVAAADSTGHGVPGAFMSLLGIAALNDAVYSCYKQKDKFHAGTILDELRFNIKKALRQSPEEIMAKDGIDIALCIIDFREQTLEYAGAYNPLLLIRNGELTIYRGDRMPIGHYIREKKHFTNHVIPIQNKDSFYMFSDGFADQIGGEDVRKYMLKNLKKLLLQNSDKDFVIQKQNIEQEFDTWKGKRKQIDDILVIGFQINFDQLTVRLGSEDWSNRKILIAEDDEFSFITLNEYLRKYNFTIIHADNGKDAVELHAKEKPDIIIMDIQMPVMDGIEAIRHIRLTDKLTPIIVQTAFNISRERQISFQEGANDFLLKPIDQSELFAMISRHLL